MSKEVKSLRKSKAWESVELSKERRPKERVQIDLQEEKVSRESCVTDRIGREA
jgi:hypothetical protein